MNTESKMLMVLLIYVASVLPWNLLVAADNEIENSYLGFFQGDIMIRNKTDSMDRSAIVNADGRWPGGQVVYALDDTYSDEDREIIKSAIEEFEKQTCIRWIERTDEDVFVEIENDMGCWSELGRVGGIQSLSLESPICMRKGVVMHERMHTLGFLHEQSRSDRDDYVRIVCDNIISGMEPNFQKLSSGEIDDLGLEYDYRSIMHYTAYMYAIDRSQPTLRPKKQGVHLSDLGYAQKNAAFTDLDVQKINKFYECPGK